VKRWLFVLILLAVSHFAHPVQSEWRTVEEVLAVVGDTPILYSDIELARLLQLLVPDHEEPDLDYRSRLLDARIRLEIEFRELEDSGLLYRLDLDSAAVRKTVIDRAGGEEALAEALGETGLVWPDVDEVVLRLASVEAFVEQRLRPRVTVTIEEIETAYQEMLVNQIAASDESVPPLATVREHLHQILVGRKLNEEIEQWLERATARQEVLRFGY
jgi:hypothetical protein